MIQSHWFVLIALATIFTLGWLYTQRRTLVTSLLAGSLWAIVALSARTLEKVTNDGTVVDVSAGGLQWVFAALALLSLLAGILYVVGVYPPEQDGLQTDDRASSGASPRAPGDD